MDPVRNSLPVGDILLARDNLVLGSRRFVGDIGWAVGTGFGVGLRKGFGHQRCRLVVRIADR